MCRGFKEAFDLFGTENFVGVLFPIVDPAQEVNVMNEMVDNQGLATMYPEHDSECATNERSLGEDSGIASVISYGYFPFYDPQSSYEEWRSSGDWSMLSKISDDAANEGSYPKDISSSSYPDGNLRPESSRDLYDPVSHPIPFSTWDNSDITGSGNIYATQQSEQAHCNSAYALDEQNILSSEQLFGSKEGNEISTEDRRSNIEWDFFERCKNEMYELYVRERDGRDVDACNTSDSRCEPVASQSNDVFLENIPAPEEPRTEECSLSCCKRSGHFFSVEISFCVFV
ncbi:hypothetical protein KIN20_026157 [Parelaphostrongylus tenuis]|uniref:Uncharacterized protein n=1 Tax=Parelaphostrongylus tenuis TaxID=148309 RepID=A0AAD5N9K3_PARTN|nr:hypothetical protein KIN20_026157 [Parelaphostrongylus tenuis]